jgi:hypothetical protein
MMMQWTHVMVVYAWVASGCAGGLPEAEMPVRGDQQSAMPVPVPRSDLEVRFGADLGTQAPLLAGGSTLVVRIGAAPGTAVTWWLAFEGTVIAHGRLTIAPSAAGSLRLTMPRVYHRAPLELALASMTSTVRYPLIVYPASALGAATERLRSTRIGVIDPTGHVRSALAGEGVFYEDLKPGIARDYFEGEIVVLAGYDDAAALGEICKQLDLRINGGTRVLVLNPPADWAAWQLRRKALTVPERGAVALADGFCPSVPVEDFGAGPWHALVEGPPGATALVATPRPSSAIPAPAAPATGVLGGLVLCPVDRGYVMVSVLPQTEFPDRDVVGRMLLAEMVLWTLDAPSTSRTQPMENRHE